MKKLIGTFLFALLLLSCSTDDDTTPKSDILSGTWDVQNISGGFAGINDDYETGVITWTFTSSNGTLKVVNNNEEDTLWDGLPTGNYTYSILTEEGDMFLIINNQERFGIILSDGQLLLDENITSTGTGADGFQILLAP